MYRSPGLSRIMTDGRYSAYTQSASDSGDYRGRSQMNVCEWSWAKDPSRYRCPIQRHPCSYAWRLRPARVKGRNCNIERYKEGVDAEEGQAGSGGGENEAKGDMVRSGMPGS